MTGYANKKKAIQQNEITETLTLKLVKISNIEMSDKSTCKNMEMLKAKNNNYC
jgi:hypothetical protein